MVSVTGEHWIPVHPSMHPASSSTVRLWMAPPAIIQNMTEKMLMYAVGRESHYYDMPAIRTIAQNAARNDYRMSSLILGIVNSPAFQMRRKTKPEEAR